MQRLRELFAQFTLARLLIAVLLAQLTAVVCLLIYLAATGQPGMPIGPPGMEGPDAKPYSVLAIQKDGSYEVFSNHPA